MPSARDFLGLPPEDADVETRVGINPVENLRSIREETEREFGTQTGLPDATVGARPDAIDPREQGVDIFTDVTSAKQRLSMAFLEGQRLNQYLDKQFGSGNWRQLDGKLIIRDKEGNEHLSDNFGFNSNDFVDAAPLVVEGLGSGGAIGGALKFAGRKAAEKIGSSTLLLSALGSLGAQGAGGSAQLLTELFTQVGEVDMQRAKRIAEDRGPDAAVDFLLGVLGGKGLEFFSRKYEGTGLPSDVSSAVDRLKKATGEEVPVTAGQLTGNPSLQRIETIASKVPFSSEVFKERARAREAAISRITNQLAPKDEDGAFDVVNFLQGKYDEADANLAAERRKFDSLVQQRVDHLAESPFGDVSFEDAGVILTNSHTRRLDDFRTTANNRYLEVETLPGGDDPVVSADFIREKFKEVADKRSLPTEGKGEKVVRIFSTPEVEQFLKSVENMDDMTLRQARNARRVINDAIRQGEAVPGQATRHLRMLSGALTESIEKAVENLPGETGEALLRANTYYKNNVDDFLLPGTAEFLVKPGEKGFLTNQERMVKTVLSGDPERVRNAMSALSLSERRAISGAVIKDAFEKARIDFLDPTRPGGESIDPQKLNTLLRQVPIRVLEDMLGAKNVQELFTVTQSIAVRQGKLDIDLANALSDTDTLTEALRNAARAEAAFTKEWKNSVVAGFIEGKIDPAKFPPEEFVPRIIGLDKRTVSQVSARLAEDPEVHRKFQKQTIRHLLEKGTKSADAGDVGGGFANPGDQVLSGAALNEAITTVGEEKLRSLLGDESVQILKDISTLKIGSSQQAASQAGGLIAGGLVSYLLHSPTRAAPVIAYYRAVASILTAPPVVKALDVLGRRGRNVPDVSGRERAIAVATAQIAENLEEEFRDDPNMGKEVRKALAEATGIPGLAPKPSAREFLGEPQ